MTRRRLSRLLNLLIAALVLAAWFSITFIPGGHGRLSAEGLVNLRYFTVLSNLLQGVASLACALGRHSPRRLRYIAVTAVSLTFFTALLFLGPAYGYDAMYAGANFWFHLVVPLLAMADFLLLDREDAYTLGDCLLAMLPMLAYSVNYVGNLLRNGTRHNDWYGFAVHGPGDAVKAFLILLLTNAILALLLRLPKRCANQ